LIPLKRDAVIIPTRTTLNPHLTIHIETCALRAASTLTEEGGEFICVSARARRQSGT
jgi:hypothetical protein